MKVSYTRFSPAGRRPCLVELFLSEEGKVVRIRRKEERKTVSIDRTDESFFKELKEEYRYLRKLSEVADSIKKDLKI